MKNKKNKFFNKISIEQILLMRLIIKNIWNFEK